MDNNQNQESEVAAETVAESGMNIAPEFIEDGKILGQFENVTELLNAAVRGGVEAQPDTILQNAPDAPADSPAELQDAPESFKTTQQQETPQEGVVNFGKYTEEILQQGELSDNSFKELEKLGLGRSEVEGFIEGQKALARERNAKIADQAGGIEIVNKALEWAGNTLSPEECAQIDNALANASDVGQAAILRDLVSRSGQSRSAIQGDNTATLGAAPFRDEHEYNQALMSEDYDQSPAYRQQVEERLRASMKMGTIL